MSPDVDAARAAILDPPMLHTRASALDRLSSIPAAPGLYGWYFDEIPPGVPDENLAKIDAGALLYVGIFPKEPSMNGKPPSKSNLRKRIQAHYRGNASQSTLRFTLGCHLSEQLGFQLRRVGATERLTFTPPGEVTLNDWMAAHARVAIFEHPRPWEVEPVLIAGQSLPLNLDHNSAHDYFTTLQKLRSEHRARARSLPVWSR